MFLWLEFLMMDFINDDESCFEATCRQNIAPIVAAARCFVSEMGMQRLQRIAGSTWDERRIWAPYGNYK
ncbi:MAG: hypothetical protein WCL14_06680 [Bacteroidota bacterium]